MGFTGVEKVERQGEGILCIENVYRFMVLDKASI